MINFVFCCIVFNYLYHNFHRSASLQHVNNMLREQLEQATSANQQLTLDIQKLTADWNKAREEIEARDEEEQAYFANEHVRLMDMWKTMNNFRRQFNEMKSATQRFVQVNDCSPHGCTSPNGHMPHQGQSLGQHHVPFGSFGVAARSSRLTRPCSASFWTKLKTAFNHAESACKTCFSIL